MSDFSTFDLYGEKLAVKDAVARNSIADLENVCAMIQQTINNLTEKSLNHDESIADITNELELINSTITDIESSLSGLDGDVNVLKTDVTNIKVDLENLQIIVDADNETETYEYTDETYGIKVTFYRRGKNVFMYLRTLSGLLAELPTQSKYFTLLTIPTQFRPAINTIMTRPFTTMYGGQVNIGQSIQIGYSYRMNYVTYDSRSETISYARETESFNLPKGFSFYYRDSWIVE